MKRYPVIHTKFKRYTRSRPNRLEPKRKIKKKVVIRYSIKNSLAQRVRSGGEDHRRVFYEPLNREGFSSHIAEFGARIMGTHQGGYERVSK